MNRKRIFALAFAVLMVLALAACGMKNNDKMGDMSGNGSAMTGEPKNAEEALALHKELLEQENAILSEKTELWENVFMEAEKGMAMFQAILLPAAIHIFLNMFPTFLFPHIRSGISVPAGKREAISQQQQTVSSGWPRNTGESLSCESFLLSPSFRV